MYSSDTGRGNSREEGGGRAPPKSRRAQGLRTRAARRCAARRQICDDRTTLREQWFAEGHGAVAYPAAAGGGGSVADDGGAGECVTPLKTGCCAKGCRDASALLPVAVSPHEILLDWKWDGDHGNVPGTPPSPPPPSY